jgi:hypothetical protein
LPLKITTLSNTNDMSKTHELIGNPQTGNSSLGVVMPRFSKQDVIDCLKQRDKEAFDNPYQKYEHREINQAIDIIKRLMPPSSFPNGA